MEKEKLLEKMEDVLDDIKEDVKAGHVDGIEMWTQKLIEFAEKLKSENHSKLEDEIVSGESEETIEEELEPELEDKNLMDAIVALDKSVDLNDGMGGLLRILGGIGIVAAENRGLLQRSNPTTAQSALKSVGIMGAGLVSAGSAIMRFCERNMRR